MSWNPVPQGHIRGESCWRPAYDEVSMDLPGVGGDPPQCMGPGALSQTDGLHAFRGAGDIEDYDSVVLECHRRCLETGDGVAAVSCQGEHGNQD